MPVKTLEISVEDDHLARIAQTRKPLLALAELVWNSADADATEVAIEIAENPMGGIQSITVSDNGHSIPYQQADALFTKLGGSWKLSRKRTLERQRILHGKEGRGRFRAFALARVVQWDLCYEVKGRLRQYTVTMTADHLRQVKVQDESNAPKGASRGTVVRLTEIVKNFRSLLDTAATDELATIFALYLRQYPDLRISYRERKIDPAGVEERSERFNLSSIRDTETDGEEFPVSLEIVEWKIDSPRKLYLCDWEGFPLDDVAPGVQAAGFNFTAYLKSDYFERLLEENALDLASMNPAVNEAVEEAKQKMRGYFRQRAADRAAGLVKEWQSADVDPYKGTPQNPVEVAERQVFDVVALNVHHYLPEFATSDDKTKRFQMRLLRQAIERSPEDLTVILDEVLGLSPDRQQELAELLKRTTLAAVIGASKIVADRLEFLRGLEALVFDPAFKDDVLERTQLHRIVAENVWMFGEQYSLSVDDESLTEVLKQHIRQQGLDIEIDEPVLDQYGKRRIVDLMLSKNIPGQGDAEREHLVIELKRPNVAVDAAAAMQIEKYAFAVATDDRFRNVSTRWVFWALSTHLDQYVVRRAQQRDRAKGIIHQDAENQITIWVKPWAEIIEDCKRRLLFSRRNSTIRRRATLHWNT